MSKTHVSRVRELYKLILRLHRSLPDELKILGDNYAKEEFKRHKKCKPQEAQIFLNEWRDYAMSLSRQAAPARQPRSQPGSPRPNSPRPASPRPGPSREVREERPQAEEIADPELPRLVDAEALYRYGVDLPPGRVFQMTPEQLYTLYMLQVNARGENTAEPIDEGIDLTEADKFAKQIEEAKKHILAIEKEEKEKLFRGEITFEDVSFQTKWWLELFDDAVSVKDRKADADNALIDKREAEQAKAAEPVNEPKKRDSDVEGLSKALNKQDTENPKSENADVLNAQNAEGNAEKNQAEK